MKFMETKVTQIPLFRPELGEEELRGVGTVLDSGWLTQGPQVLAFEREFAEFVGAPHACAVSSCTSALHLALKAAGVGPGHEVITVSHSFIATANSIAYCGALPVFVDIDPTTYNIDIARVEAAMTPRTRAILCVHQIGMPCDLISLSKLAKARGVFLIEDAACAIGSEILWDGKWERIGKPHGDAACFSFHPRKLLTTGDGGMITTRHENWDKNFRKWRQHGMSADDLKRHSAQTVVFESYDELGFNYRLTDVQAAIGRAQLKRLSGIVERRRQLASRYHEYLSGVPGLILPQDSPFTRTNYQSYCVRLPENVEQRAFMQAALEQGIVTRRGIMCAHREPAYAGKWRCGSCGEKTCTHLSQSEAAQDHGVLLPLFGGMSDRDQERVCQYTSDYCKGAAR